MGSTTKSLQEYIRYSRYAKYIDSEKRKESWNEQVDRVFNTHNTKYQENLKDNSELQKYFQFAENTYRRQLVLGSQRILQFAGDLNGGGKDPILSHEARVFNCSVTPLDRDKVFSEIFYMLLCGCGVGFSVRIPNVQKLPDLHHLGKTVKEFSVEDSIEGWADALGVLMASYFRVSDNDQFKEFYGCRIEFNFSKVRLKGSYINGGFKAPGPDGLQTSLIDIKNLIESRLSSKAFKTDAFRGKLSSINSYDIVMHTSDAVLSGGVRRSAAICIFDKEDDDMLNAKTGNWFLENPQRSRSNNSVLLLRGKTSKVEFDEILEKVKQSGEPGFIWTDNLDTLYNPCVEVGFHPYIYKDTETGKELKLSEFNPENVHHKRLSGWSSCNLTEINGKAATTRELFLEACKASAIIGTIQAGYTNFKYLAQTSKEIVEKEALLGCSITGFMDNPTICLDKEILKEGARLIKDTNKEVARLLGINQAARTTCVKPAGSTSALLGTSSGIHGHHSKRYIRHVQVNKEEAAGQYYKEINPASVEESVWSANKTDNVISFLIESSKDAILKDELLNSKQLEYVKLVQQYWVEEGTNVELCTDKTVRHNVSNTINVTNWDEVGDYIYNNQSYLAGVSFISHSGDKDYAQAPNTSVLTSKEILEKYGVGSLFASGLIVDGLEVFEGDLWLGISTAIKYSKPSHWEGLDLTDDTLYRVKDKITWSKRFSKFAINYTDNDYLKCNYLLKDVYNLHKWNKIELSYKDIDWNSLSLEEEFTDIDTMGSIACSGGSCEIL